MTSKLITTVVAATIAAAASATVYDVKFTVKTINDKGKFGTVTIQGAYDEATGLSYFWDRKTKAPIAGASFGAEMNVTETGKKVLANAELVWDNNKSALVVGSSGTDTSLTGNFGGMIDEVPAYGTYSFKASKKSIEKIVPAAFSMRVRKLSLSLVPRWLLSSTSLRRSLRPRSVQKMRLRKRERLFRKSLKC